MNQLLWQKLLVVNVVPDSIYPCSAGCLLVLFQTGSWSNRRSRGNSRSPVVLWGFPLGIALMGTELVMEALENHPPDRAASSPDRCYIWPSYSILLESRDLWANSVIYGVWFWSWWHAGSWTLDCFWSFGLAMLRWHGSRAEFSKFCSSGQ